MNDIHPRVMRYIALFLAVAVACRTAEVRDAQSYLDAKARFVEEAQTPARSGNNLKPFLDSARKDLEARLSVLIQPVSFDGMPGAFNPGWLTREGVEGGELDAIRFGSLISDTVVLVTDEQVMAAWVRAEGDSAADPFVGVGNHDVLTWVLGMNAHATVFTDVRRHASLPPEVPLALLITHAQDVVGRAAPRKLVLGIRRGTRAVLVFVKAAEVPPPAECVQALDAAIKASGRYFDEEEKVFMTCYDRLAPQKPAFRRVVDQALEWNRTIATKVP